MKKYIKMYGTLIFNINVFLDFLILTYWFIIYINYFRQYDLKIV